MRIDSMTIHHFGKLKDFSLSFDKGFTVLYGENEQGKSTIMAFIRMMFYGTSSRVVDLARNPRKRYMPWDGSKMSGSLEFTFDNKRFRLEKTFGTTPRTDRVKLWNLTTNIEEPVVDAAELGRRFLGMGEEAFEKSLYISQIGSIIHSDKDKENEIIQKLQNLVSSGDETQSYHIVETRIATAMEKIKSKSGRIGVLDRLIKERSILAEEKNVAISVQADKDRMHQQYLELLNKREIDSSLLSEKNVLMEQIRDYRKYQEYERILAKKKNISELSEELAKIKNDLSSEGHLVDLAFLETAQKHLQDLVNKISIMQSKKVEFQEKEQIEDGNEENKLVEFSEETYENAEFLMKQIRSKNEEIHDLQIKFQQMEYENRSVRSLEEQFARNNTKLRDYKNQIKNIEDKIQIVQSAKENRDSNNKENTPVISSILCIGSILALIAAELVFKQPLLMLLAALPVVIIVVIWLRHIKTMKQSLLQEETTQIRAQEEKMSLLGNIDFYNKQCNDILKDQEQLQEKITDCFANAIQKVDSMQNPSFDDVLLNNPLSKVKGYPLQDEIVRAFTEEGKQDPENFDYSISIQKYLDNLEKKIRQIREQMESDQMKLNQIFLQYGVPDFAGFQEKAFQIRNQAARKDESLRDNEQKREQYQLLEADFNIALEDFNQSCIFLPGFNPVSAIELVSDKTTNLFENIKQQLYQSQSIQTMIDDKTRDLRQTLNARPISLIQDEFEKMRQDYDSGVSITPGREISLEETVLLENEIETLRNAVSTTDISLARMKTEITQIFLDKPELADVEDRIIENEKRQSALQDRYSTLSIAKEQLEMAFLEMQQTFGPIVNAKAAGIFSKITNGRYSELLISKDLNISFRDPALNSTQDWQYLSGGAADQVYFSLRLAICEFLSEQKDGLPLFIDDAFLQYDDVRTRNSLVFLEDYARNQSAQILFFTCHKNLLDQCGSETKRVML